MNLENLTPEEQFFKSSVERSGIPTSAQEFENEFSQIAQQEQVPFANPSEFSPFWRFVQKALAIPALWIVSFLIRVVMPSNFLKTAKGDALDIKGWDSDTERKKPRRAEGVITFYRASTDTKAKVPSGAYVRTVPINGKVYRMFTTAEAVFPAGSLVATAPVKAEKEGEEYNLAAGYYSILESPVTGIIRTNNEANWLIVPGTSREDDESYRARIRAKTTALSDHHTNSVYKTIISQFGGIDYDRIFIDNTLAPRGPGSADAHVLFDAGEASESFLLAVNKHINEGGYHGLGDDLQVLALPETQQQVELTIYFANGVNAQRKEEIENTAEQIIRAAFRETKEFPEVLRVWPSSRFSMQKLGDNITRRFGDDIESITWQTQDIVSGWDIPRVESLTINTEDVAT